MQLISDLKLLLDIYHSLPQCLVLSDCDVLSKEPEPPKQSTKQEPFLSETAKYSETKKAYADTPKSFHFSDMNVLRFQKRLYHKKQLIDIFSQSDKAIYYELIAGKNVMGISTDGKTMVFYEYNPCSNYYERFGSAPLI